MQLSEVASTVIGKVMMWIIAVLIAVIVGMSGWVYVLKADIKVEKALKDGIENALTIQSGMIDANRVEYETNLDRAKQIKERTRIEYVSKIEYIEKGIDKNATCENAMQFIDNYVY